MQRAPGEERIFRVAYGDGELEFMLQPWFDVDVADPSRPIRTPYDIVIAGVGKPDDSDLGRALRAAAYLRLSRTPAVRDGGVLIIPAQLEDGEGEGLGEELALLLEGCLVVIAASESPEVARLAQLRAAVDVEEALDIAYEHIGRPQRASVLLVRALNRSPS
jgi:hypothetical protein